MRQLIIKLQVNCGDLRMQRARAFGSPNYRVARVACRRRNLNGTSAEVERLFAANYEQV